MFGIKSKKDEPQLGDLVKDRITGFTGVVECVSEWLNACKRLTVTSKELKDGMPLGSQTFDILQLEVIEKGYYDKPKIKQKEKTGGPCIEPARRNSPSRF